MKPWEIWQMGMSTVVRLGHQVYRVFLFDVRHLAAAVIIPIIAAACYPALDGVHEHGPGVLAELHGEVVNLPQLLIVYPGHDCAYYK